MGAGDQAEVKKLYAGVEKLRWRAREQLTDKEKQRLSDRTAEALRWLEARRDALLKVSTPQSAMLFRTAP